MNSLNCPNCNKLNPILGSVKRTDQCFSCGMDFHSCQMCLYYDPACYNGCREPKAERIVDKSKANFCDFFMITSPTTKSYDKNNLLNAAEALFKKNS